MKKTLPLEELVEIQRSFVRERDWEKFHTPKNLAGSLMVEAAELFELFQWAGDEKPPADRMERVRDEMADTFYYLLRLADVLDVDLETSFHAKMAKNAEKYPAEKARGRMTKYDEL